MKRCYGINAKLMDVIRKVMVRNVLAEEPVPPQQTQTVSYEQLIARARQEEKDKLYPQLQAEKDKVKELIQKNNELLVKMGSLKNEYDVVKDLYRDGDDILGKERAARYLEDTAKQDIRLKTGRYREMLNSLFNYIKSNY